MKKYLFPALALGLVMTSCQSDEPFAPTEGGEKQVTFTLNVPGELGTRAAAGANQSDKGGATNQGADQIKYTLVLQANNDTQILDNSKATVSGTTATFTPTVVLGREYTITAYASLKDAWNGVNPIAITNSFNDESKDAYFKTLKHNFANGDLQPLTLTRPFGKLRLVAEDYDPAKTKVESVKITYANPQEGTFNATTEAFTIATENVAGTTKPFGYYEAADATGAHAIFAEYLPAPKTGEYPVTFTVEVKYDGSTETYSRTFNDIPVRRNALTTLKGNFFTAGAEITVEVEDAFDNSEAVNKNFVSTASQLQEAIDNATPGETTEIILDGNIDLTQPIVFGAPSVNPAPAQTRSGATNSFVLNLNGKTISNPNGYAIENYSKLTISGEGNMEGLGGIRSHGGKLIIEGGNYTCSSNWSTGTFNHILKAENTEVVINDGTFDATVGGTNNAMINVSENSVVTINAGTFKNVNGVIPQFAPYMFTYEKNGKLIINGGDFYGGWRFNGETATTDIYGGNFTVSYDGQSFHANSTHVFTIYGGTFSLENGGKLNPENYVATGYTAVKQNDGTWVVVVVATANDAASLATAVAKGGVIVLEGDIELDETIVIPTGVTATLDLNGKTITASTTDGFKVNTGAKLTISGNGKVESNGAPIRALGGEVVVENGTFTQTGTHNSTTSTYRYCVDSRDGGQITIKGGTFNTGNGMFNINPESSIIVNGGKFEYNNTRGGTRHFAYVSGDLTINDGEFKGVADASAGGCFFCGAAATANVTVNGGKFTSLWSSGSKNNIWESYYGGSIEIKGGIFNHNGGIKDQVTENTDAATKDAYPYKAK